MPSCPSLPRTSATSSTGRPSPSRSRAERAIESAGGGGSRTKLHSVLRRCKLGPAGISAPPGCVGEKMKTPTRILLGLSAALVLLVAFGRDLAAGQETAAEPTLPVAVVIGAPESALYRIAVPDLLGTTGLGAQGAGVLRNDFAL